MSPLHGASEKTMAEVAHEARNALQQIEACSSLLEVRIQDDAEARELIADLRKAQQRLRRLFDNLPRKQG